MKLSDLAELAKLKSDSPLEANNAQANNAKTNNTENKTAEQKTGYDGKPVTLTVALDTKGRKGKAVSCIRGFQSSPAELEQLAQTLKKLCGSGGSVGDNTIELQGNHVQRLKQKLAEWGYRVK